MKDQNKEFLKFSTKYTIVIILLTIIVCSLLFSCTNKPEQLVIIDNKPKVYVKKKVKALKEAIVTHVERATLINSSQAVSMVNTCYYAVYTDTTDEEITLSEYVFWHVGDSVLTGFEKQ